MQNNKTPKISNLRVEGEQITLTISILVGFLIAYFIFGVDFYLAISLIMLALIYVILVNSSFIGNSFLITRKALPDVYRILELSSKKIGVKIPKLYIQQNPEMNAFAIGIINPSIVLTSGLFDVMDDEELEFIIAHELGHIYFRHNVISTIVYPAGKQIPIINFFSGFWSRKAEYSADRIGLYCSGNLNQSISALTKLAIGIKLSKKISLDIFSTQIDEINNSIEKIAETISNHPYSVNRIAKLIQYKTKVSDLIKDDY